jgi:hypothetical protein
VLSRSLPRFLLQAGLLIGVAAFAVVLHLDAWSIVIVMAAAFGGVLLAEWLTTRAAGVRTVTAAAGVAESVPAPVPEPKPIAAPPSKPARAKGTPLLRPPGAEPRPVVVPPLVPPPVPPPARESPAPPPPPPPPPIAPRVVERRRWNVFDLREFADVADDLSADFDGFVRESFPELIASG